MMRNRTKTSSRKLTRIAVRRHRLTLLAAVVVGSGICGSHGLHVIAANPGTVTRGVLPPLPVEVSPRAAEVQNNPFFQPTTPSAEPSILLASGDADSAIRLRPIGRPIDLNTIGEDPVRLRPSTIAIEPAPVPDIRNNPLVGSVHHENRDLVESPASDIPPVPQEAFAKAQTPFTPSIPEFRSPVVAVKPLTEAISNDQFAARDERRQVSTPQKPDQVQSPMAVQLAADARDGRGPIAESQPIYFSITDEADMGLPLVAEPIVMAEEPIMAELDEADSESLSVNPARDFVAEEPTAHLTPETEDEIGSVGQMGPVMSDVPADPIQIEEQNLVLNDADKFNADIVNATNVGGDDGETMPSESQGLSPAPKAIYQDAQPIVTAPVATPEPTLLQQRFRPPVAVDSPPIALTRELSAESRTVSAPTVQSVEAPSIALEEIDELTEVPGLPGASDVKPSTLYLSRTQVRSLTISGHVRRIAVGDKNVCQAFAAGPNQLKLIGTGNGVTRLVVWADASDSAPTRVRSFEIRVEDKAIPVGVSDKATVLNESIRNAFPGSRIHVQQQNDCLVVVGQCQSEETAKQIIRMIRKTCLIPVRDEIQVR